MDDQEKIVSLEEKTDLKLINEEVQESELSAIECTPESEEEEEILTKKKSLKPSWYAGLGAILAIVLAIFVFPLTLSNGLLGGLGFFGVLTELFHRNESAFRVYQEMSIIERDMTEKFGAALAILSPNKEMQGIGTGNFLQTRELSMLGRMYTPLYYLEYFNNTFQEGVRIPRYFRKDVVELKAFGKVVGRINATDVENSTESDAAFRAVQKARLEDPEVKNGIFYDYFELLVHPDQLSEDWLSRLEALQQQKNVKFWMFEDFLLERELEEKNYAALEALATRRLKRNLQDETALIFQIRSIYLENNRKKAYRMAEKYKRDEVLSSVAQLISVELLYRDEKYEKALRGCDTILEKESNSKHILSEALREKAVVHLLQGEHQVGFDLLREALESQRVEPSNQILGTLLVSALSAQEMEYYDNFMEQQMPMFEQYYRLRLPKEVELFRTENISIKELFTDGWGGMNS